MRQGIEGNGRSVRRPRLRPVDGERLERQETALLSAQEIAAPQTQDGPTLGRDTALAPPPGRPAGARSTVVIGIHDLGFHQEVLDFLGRDPRIEVVGAAVESRRFLELMATADPDVTLACPAVTREFRPPPASPGSAHMVVAQEMTVPVLRDAIDARARAVFAWPEERDELAQEIAEASSARSGAQTPLGRVISILGARGGAGTTFVATHLAAAYADGDLRTVLVDLDASFADVSVALGVPRGDGERRTVADLLPVAEELALDHVADALFQHRRGFAVLLAPPEGFDAAVPPTLYRDSVGLLATEFDAIVLHLPHALGEGAKATATLADDVALVTALDLFSLHGAQRVMSAMQLREESRWRVVLNRVARAEITAADVERMLGGKICAEIRFDPGVPHSQNRGELLPAGARRAGRDIRSLALVLGPAPASTPNATGAPNAPGRRRTRRRVT